MRQRGQGCETTAVSMHGKVRQTPGKETQRGEKKKTFRCFDIEEIMDSCVGGSCHKGRTVDQ